MMLQTYSTSDENETLVWSIPRLWELAKDLPMETVPLAALAPALDNVCWFDDDAPATARAVVEHARRIAEVDFVFPIILSSEGAVMDGMHRLAKALLLGKQEVTVVRFEVNPEPNERIQHRESRQETY